MTPFRTHLDNSGQSGHLQILNYMCKDLFSPNRVTFTSSRDYVFDPDTFGRPFPAYNKIIWLTAAPHPTHTDIHKLPDLSRPHYGAQPFICIFISHGEQISGRCQELSALAEWTPCNSGSPCDKKATLTPPHLFRESPCLNTLGR